MAKKVKVDVEVNTNADEAGEKFVKLQTRIRETKVALQKAVESGDTKAINKLKEDLDQLQDIFEKTQVQSKKFGDSLAEVPGPAGAVGKAVKGLDDAFKFLIANPIVAVIAAVGGALLGMYKALQQTKEGQEVLNKVSDAFGSILEVVTNIVTAVAIPVFEFFGSVINKIGEAFAYVTGKSEEYKKSIADKQAARDFEANAERIKKKLDEEGFKYDEFTKKKIEADLKYNERLAAINKSKDSEAEKSRLKQLAIQEKNKAIQDADAGRAKVAADQAKANQDKIIAAQDKARAAAEKAFNDKISRMQSEDKLDEAKLEKLKQEALAVAKNEREKFEIEKKFSEEKYLLQRTNLEQLQKEYKKGSKEYQDFQTQLISLDAQRVGQLTSDKEKIKKLNEDEVKDKQNALKLLEDAEIAAIKNEDDRAIIEYEKKRSRERIELEKSKEFLLLNEEQRKRLLSDFDAATEAENQNRLENKKANALKEELEILNVRKNAVLEGTAEYFSIIRQIEDNAYQQKLIAAKDNAAQIEAVEREHKANLENIAQQEKIAQFNIAKERFDTIARFGDALSKVAGKNKTLAKAAVVIQKAAAIGQIVANTGIANAKAVAVSPLTGGLPWTAINTATAALSIGATIAEAVKSIQEINKVPGTESGGGGVSASGGAPAIPAFAGSVQAAAPQIGRSAVSREGGIGEIIGQAMTEKPIQAYVIGSQVTSQQELDRRITLSARMGG